MGSSHNKYSISHSLLFVVLLGYCANYFTGGIANQYLELIPAKVWSNFELWRLISYPLAIPGLESILLFSFSFYFVASKIESLFKEKVYPIFLGLMVLFQGIFVSLVFRDSAIVFSGADGISFLMIFLFVLLSLNSKSIPNWYKPARTVAFSLLTGVLWLSVLMYRSDISNSNVVVASSFNALFGMFFGVITFLKIRSEIITRKKNRIENQLPYVIPTPEELKYALMGEVRKKQFNSLEDEYNYPISDEFQPDEDRLNEILDKISEYGKDSLTVSEIKYLENYSNSI